MENKELNNLLQQLEKEIKNTQSVDDEGRVLLNDLEGDIRNLLERSGESPMQLHPSIVQSLKDSLDHFEVTHPELTALISRLLDSLSNAGI